ncbi:MAG: cellulase family glycosylhydrolase, partial [Kiritimatiellae bacterium]|nr:cellulase family glycosylhydrolase [Kiritimatiellia bacterium]
MSRLISASIFASAALCSLTCSAAVDPGFFGVCEHVNDAGGVFLSRNRVYNLCNRAGITWLRVDFPWAEIEPSRGTWQWDRFDAIVADAEAHGIQILPILDYGSAYGGHPQLVSDDMDGWLAYVRAVLTRYAGRFPAVEVWNEPDYSVFWSGTAAQFATLVQRTYAAVKAVDSSITVVLGGLTGANWDYLSSLYAAGIKDYCDVIAFHPYCHPMAPDADYEDKSYYKSRSGNWLTGYSYTYYGQMEYRIRRFRDVMSANGDGSKPVWLTEHGWPTHTAGGVSEADQATYLAKALDIAVACGVEKYFVYNLVAFEGDLANGEHCFGVVHRDFTAKPAYTALQSKITSLAGASADPYADHVWLTFGDYTDGATVSWSSRGYWSDGAAPSADKDYLVDIGVQPDARLLSTIQDHAETTFAGRSLTLGRVGGRAGYFSHEGWGSTVTVSRLVLGGGLATAGGGTGDGGQWL